nr:MAG TPA: hypothetical protein [Caudoviricetes sp.]
MAIICHGFPFVNDFFYFLFCSPERKPFLRHSVADYGKSNPIRRNTYFGLETHCFPGAMLKEKEVPPCLS